MLPAIILGFIISFPMIYLVFTQLMSDLGYIPSVTPSWQAVLIALFVGLFIPLVSSIVPIKRSLSKNLTETLDTSRGKTKGTLVSVYNTKALDITPYMLFGSIAVAMGMTVYYWLPLSLLQFHVGMILVIFFALLFAILLGLILYDFISERAC